MKKKSFKNDIVYSTSDNVVKESEEEAVQSIEPHDQLLYVEVDRKQRRGKSVTVITNFKGHADDLKDLGKLLKSKCGVGGTTKNGQIEIQGDVRDKIILELEKIGYKTKKKGG
jgi:translation initiation factor 1